jgi:hypothetical protein
MDDEVVFVNAKNIDLKSVRNKIAERLLPNRKICDNRMRGDLTIKERFEHEEE